MMETVLDIGFLGLTAAVVLALWRLARGPTIMDRILAFDAIAICVVGMIVLLSIRWNSVYFLELIIVVTLLGFISGVAFVMYLDKTLESHPDEPSDSPPGSNPERKIDS